MNRRGASLGVIIISFIAIIVCLAMLGEVMNTQSQLTDKQSVFNESIDISSGRDLTAGNNEVNTSASNFTVSNTPKNDWRHNSSACGISNVIFGNQTENFTLTTDYLIYDQEGVIFVKNTTETVGSTNDTFVFYDFCFAGYNTDAGSRSIAGLFTLFAALALIGWVIAYGSKEWGWFK